MSRVQQFSAGNGHYIAHRHSQLIVDIDSRDAAIKHAQTELSSCESEL